MRTVECLCLDYFLFCFAVSNFISWVLADNPLVPISWSEMVCPETYVKERRKIARIIAGEQPPPPPSDSIQ